MANEAFPAGPDRVALYPAAGQQYVLAALQQDVTAGQHLLCVTGPAGSGKTVLLRALQQRLGPGLVELIEKPTPGSVLIDVARALHLDMTDDADTMLRRQLVVMLSTIEKQHIPIIQIVDDADRLTTDDLNLLMHFFPAGHATLILAGVTAPQACLADGATTSGSTPAVRAYRIDPLSADETAGYIRHRLREAALPEDLFPPDTIAAIHQKSGGLPGAINRYCAEVLAQAEGQQNDKLAVAEPATAPSIKAQAEMLWPALDEDIVADILTAPVRKRGYGKASPAPATFKPMEITHEYDAVAKQVRRLRRRARRWRAVGVLTSITLVGVLTKNAWIDRIPWDNPLLVGLTDRFAGSSTSERSVDEAGQSSASSIPGKPAGSEAPAVVEQNASLAPAHAPATMPEPNNAGSPSPQTMSTPLPTPAPVHPAPDPSAAPIDSVSPAHEKPGTTTDTRSPQSIPTPDNAASTPPAATVSKSKRAKSKREAFRPAVSASETTLQTRTQRRAVGRLYMERAEYEWSQGNLGAAAVSIERGLASDPGNPILLRMRAQLPDVLRGP